MLVAFIFLKVISEAFTKTYGTCWTHTHTDTHTRPHIHRRGHIGTDPFSIFKPEN